MSKTREVMSMYADLCVRTPDAEKAIEIGEKLGLGMIGLVVSIEDIPKLKALADKRGWRKRPSIALGVEARAQKPGQVSKLVKSVRKSSQLIVARGGTDELNRAILEIPEVDVLISHDVQGRSGINHVLARLAKKNDISIGFDMNSLMVSYRLGRVREFSAMSETARIVRRFGAPFILTSGAMNPWDMRSPSELIAMGKQLGFTEAQARKGLSDRIIKKNRKRLSGKWIMPGVEIE